MKFTLLAFLFLFLPHSLSAQDFNSELNLYSTCDLATLNWSRSTVIEVEMDDFSFEPRHLNLRRCQPYHLKLSNQGTRRHNFRADAFFQTVLVKRDQRSPGRITSGEMRRLDLRSNDSAELYFVPTTMGRYKLKCTHFTHAARGMRGQIQVSN